MATIYVWNGATGAANGTSWTDAYTTFGAAWTAWSTNDVIKMHSGHQETSATTLTYASTGSTGRDPVAVYSVDKDASDVYTPASAYQIRVTGAGADIVFQDQTFMYGVNMEVVDGNFTLTAAGSFFRDCVFRMTGTQTNSRIWSLPTGITLFKKCTFDCDDATYGGYVTGTYASCKFEECVIEGRGLSGYIIQASGGLDGEYPWFRNCDFSGVTNSSQIMFSSYAVGRFINCKLPSGVPLGSSGSTNTLQQMIAYACAVDGAGTAKNYLVETQSVGGAIVQDTAIYRTAGWVDEEGSTPLSHKITPNSYIFSPVVFTWGPELRAYVDSTGSKTFTVYCVHDFTTAPNKDECWIEVSYLGTANSVLGSVAGGRSILSTATWTVGTEAWTGASGKTKMELSATATVNKVGTYAVRVYLGKYEASKALWYCPQVEVT